MGDAPDRVGVGLRRPVFAGSMTRPLFGLATAVAVLVIGFLHRAAVDAGGGSLDVALVAALVTAGVPSAPALASVLGYRLITAWLPLPPTA